jgi:hypothetical protein
MSFSTRNNVACVLGALTNDPQLLSGLHAKGCGTSVLFGDKKNKAKGSATPPTRPDRHQKDIEMKMVQRRGGAGPSSIE